MPEGFPTTPRAPTAVRLCAVAIGLAAVILATRVTITSTAWIGRTFPGFLLLVSRVVPSIGLADWSGFTVSGLYQSQVVAVNGEPVASAEQVYAVVGASPPGTPIRYRLQKGGVEREVTVVSQTFTIRDWVFLFGAYLVNSAVYLTCGLVVWILRPFSSLARAFLALGTALGTFFITAMDLYGPGTFARLHHVAESLASAAALQTVLLFPQPHRYARWRFAAYIPAFAIIVAYEAFLYHPRAFSLTLMINMIYLGAGAVFMALRLISDYWSGASQLVRQRVRVVTLGTLFAFGLPGLVLLISALTWGEVAMNIAGFTPFLFAVSLAYAIVKHDLLEIDAMVKRGAYYLLLTGAVGAAYLGAIVVFNSILKASAITDSAAFPVLFTFAVLLVFNPVRTRLQAFVDRVFFRTRYDSAQVLAEVGAELASALKRDQIVSLVSNCVDQAIPNAGTRLFVAQGGETELREIGRDAALPRVLVPLLAEGRILTAFDPPERYADWATHEAVRAALVEVAAEIAVPMLRRGELVGVLTAGPKRSRLFYTAGDAEFLRALAHAAASALQNAASYEALAELNESLERRVRERTAQLEATNHELADAYAELKNAEVQLVQSEKLASLGRLVAGVAHEINNPVSFIASSIAPLRRRLAQAAAGAPSAATVLAEAEELVGIMARGAERTAAIVKDLRTFSRLGEANRKAADLHDGLEVSLRLLEPRWRDRITIHRDYGALPPVECDPGQLNQVFMNLLANACDAIRDRGNIWVTTRAEEDRVTVTIRDDGAGIAPEMLGRIFDPFFTTKDVGGGTGLGLAISHGVMVAHGGRIEVESQPGAGSTFRVVLPVGAAGFSLDRAATGTG
jgi:signal transduction histidine kinase